jgi:thiol-disulfide isomerase/thioredoxin
MTPSGEGMAKERIMAIFIGLVMVMSVAGFALMSAMNQDTNPNPGFNIPSIVTRQLTSEETVYVLQTGRVLIEFFYSPNCTGCAEKTPVLEAFAQRMGEFVVLEEAPANETSLQIIGSGGKIEDIWNMTMTDQNLLETFCGIAITQPPECLMPQ